MIVEGGFEFKQNKETKRQKSHNEVGTNSEETNFALHTTKNSQTIEQRTAEQTHNDGRDEKTLPLI